jgi:hypothetical protein
MQFPIVQEYRTDVKRQNPENEIDHEPFAMEAGVFTRVFVPRHAPFFVESLQLFHPNGEPMILDEDYELFRIMPRMTELVGQGVACMITLKKPEITAGTVSYHTVGEFSLLDSSMLSLIIDAVNDDRPIYWDYLQGKPSVFPPTLHSHSMLYDLVCFQDTIQMLSELVELIEAQGMDIIERRLTHAMELIDWYIRVYGDMLNLYLKNHAESYDAHGLRADDVGLDKVDNFATATFSDVLQGRSDMHLRPQELKTIIEHYGFNSDEFLEAKVLPVAQFGNTNFIPPNIDGSFEGLGGVIETGGMCMENDGTITYLWNRMDGRTRGLYFSVLTDANDFPKTKLTYTGFKYEHPRFDVDNANVDRIAQGSGNECILVGDSFRNIYYIGLTNGSLDPAKHVYSKIDLRPLADAYFANANGHNVSEIFHWVSVAMMGDWLYIFLAAKDGNPQPDAGLDLYSNHAFKFFFRVPITSVQATVNVTAARQNVSFMDTDGVQVNNSPFWRWYTTYRDGDGNVVKGHFTYSPYPSNGFIGVYRSAPVVVAKNPNVANSYAMKMLAAHYAAYISPTLNNTMDQVLEVNYDFNPYTGVMTLKTRSPWWSANFALPYNQVAPAGWRLDSKMGYLVFFYQAQGLNILDDGRVASAGAYGFTGFPRGCMIHRMATSNSKFATVSKFWDNAREFAASSGIVPESLVSPIGSSINPRGVVYTAGGEYYVAAAKAISTSLRLFFKTVSGRYAYRPEIQNLFMGNIYSRPLTNNVREVNALPGMGAASVVVPSGYLSTYGIDVGEMQFCVSSQKSSFNRTKRGTAWNDTGVAAGDVVLIQQHTRRIENDGTITIVPSLEVLYPQWIVDALKANVQWPTIMNRGRARHVTICDPTYSNLAAKFGWLPVTVSIQYTDADGTADQFTLFTTVMTIQPTYVVSGGRYVVSGIAAITNIAHYSAPSCGVNVLRIHGSEMEYEAAQSTLGPMRVQHYLNGNALTVYFGAGVMAQTPGDAFTRDYVFTYNDRTASHAWSSVSPADHSSRGAGVNMTPDNGIQVLRGWDLSTGGAASIMEGVANYSLLGSVYPEVGWVIFFKTDINVVFNGEPYVLPLGNIDLRDIDPSPQYKTFYVYAVLDNGVPKYDISREKRLETNYQLWVATVTTNDRQILTIERYNVFAIDGHRVSETKRGSSIPAASGLANAEGQIPWIRPREVLP